MVKLLIAFGVGLGIGAAGGFVLYREKLVEHEEEVERLNNNISKLRNEIDKIHEDEKAKAQDVEFKVVEEPVDIPEEDPRDEVKAGQILIDEKQFDSEYDVFDKIDLWYYMKDDTLVDESENEVDVKSSIDKISYLVDGVVGDEVYIRNYSNETDFHVTILNDSFYPEEY